jgi:hypothetical protein
MDAAPVRKRIRDRELTPRRRRARRRIRVAASAIIRRPFAGGRILLSGFAMLGGYGSRRPRRCSSSHAKQASADPKWFWENSDSITPGGNPSSFAWISN